ncbi:MAG: MerR family transcriptional regulator [Deltaproteobacteria bacterium]|nr:MerR family transcriptional regulator [Deltaproteobacteria bacterium]
MDAFNSKMASRIVGVSLRQIQYWDERGFIRPSVKLADGRGSRRLYSFSDLVQLKVVKDLTNRGLSLQKVRRCVNHLRRSFPAREKPHDNLKYLTDGEKLFVLTSDREEILHAVEQQFILSLGIGNLVRELDGEVRRVTSRPGRRPGLGMRRRVEEKKEPSA